MKIDLVWRLSDLLNGLMAIPNLPAVLILSREVLCPKIMAGERKGKAVRVRG